MSPINVDHCYENVYSHKKDFILLTQRPCIPIDSFWFNCLIAIIFAYFNRKNNCYNHLVEAYQNCRWLAKTFKFFNKF